MGERFLRKKAFALRLHRVANTDKRDNLRRSFCEVSPEKLRLHRVEDADKRDKNCEINCPNGIAKKQKTHRFKIVDRA